jgi:acetoin utilization deacetylase AcuC-like enzyme
MCNFRLAQDEQLQQTLKDRDWYERSVHPSISYFYDEQSSAFHYGSGHPMKPHRLALTHELVLQYKLDDRMKLYGLRPATNSELQLFHSEEYVKFLNKITPDLAEAWPTSVLGKFNIAADCPIFDNLLRYGKLYTGGSIDGAKQLANGDAEVVINWAGGLHHAKKSEASGFCYVNDIVLAILGKIIFEN